MTTWKNGDEAITLYDALFTDFPPGTKVRLLSIQTPWPCRMPTFAFAKNEATGVLGDVRLKFIEEVPIAASGP